ncbi:YggS family pyridoxal phosphate-dependent enzyme [Nakamurella aerolata]|uniref:Pyridoxal phosphate homeostasis protein n=1 Tax=Nakamurella aerolata TaxID=1656892 RepID=A0A849A7N3_9ACTN|nr:YggS family pyridoxal phosphate-dependent enzyme [Nakamurella aerolata]NNG36037.1 YggS family pyridoxal phosphate-dependent enzyme [Nakamurella aerolata]
MTAAGDKAAGVDSRQAATDPAQQDQQDPREAELLERLFAAVQGIQQAAAEAGRADQVRLLLATKLVDADRIASALRVGAALIGENRVQEITGKAPQLQGVLHEKHLIGPLQKNKINTALAAESAVDCVETVDSVELAAAIDQRVEPARGDGAVLDVMIQVNVSGEPSKSGVAPEQASALAAAVAGLPRLRLTGLMTIGLNSGDEAAVRRGYARLRELRDSLVPGGELSMGMSADYRAAIAEGATIVRLGSAVFGPRTG